MLSLAVLCMCGMCGQSRAQDYPPEWVQYTFGGYLFDFQNDYNSRNYSETEFKNYLLNIARTNLAKQVKVQVQDFAQMNKSAVDGRTSITYGSVTTFSTDVDLKLVETQTKYNPATKEGFAIACISKERGRSFYTNELMMLANKIENGITMAENYIDAGFKPKAQAELEKSLPYFEKVEEPLFWMNFFGVPQADLGQWQNRLNTDEQTVKNMLAELKHGTLICIKCKADLFGASYPTLQNELKGVLSDMGCSFTDDCTAADWSITVNCYAREYTRVQVGATETFFAYVDTEVTIDKVLTSQRIAEDEISVKGGHTHDYRAAAHTAYKDVKDKIAELIKTYIK